MNNIILYPDEKLREKSEEVELPLSKEDLNLLKEMYAFVKDPNNNAVGLSAIQVGVAKRMCVIRSMVYGNFKLVNPKIIWHSTTKDLDSEGCLSVKPDVDCQVPRWTKIKITAFDAITNKNITKIFEGFAARAIQHEIDHMDGRLYIDYAINQNEVR